MKTRKILSLVLAAILVFALVPVMSLAEGIDGIVTEAKGIQKLDNVGAMLPTRDIVDERIVEEVRTGVAYYVKKLPKENPYGNTWGMRPEPCKEDGTFKYRRLANDSYKQGIITDPAQMGGYPEYKGEPYKDSDNDGMPDEWEIANGLNPNDPSDANKDCTGDGYTNIEKYINGISTKTRVDWTDLKNNHDTLAGKKKLF